MAMINEWLGPVVWAQLWQVTVVIALVGVATQLFCRHRPHLAHLLWMLVIVKCLIPPLASSPTGVFSWMRSETIAATPTTASGPGPRVIIPDKAAAGNFAVAAPPAQPPDGRATAPVRPRSFAPALLAFAAWGIGALVLAGVVAFRWWKLRAALRTPRSGEIDEDVAALVSRLCAVLRVRSSVRLLVTDDSIGPAVIGLWRPAILLPRFLLADEAREQLEPILAHELAHVRRRDTWFAALQLAAQIVWWFHPLMWWASRRTSQARERCCDEAAIAGAGCSPADYVRALLAVLQARRQLRPLLGLPGVWPQYVTSTRVEIIMQHADRFRVCSPLSAWFVFLAAACMLLPGAGMVLKADAPDDPRKPSEEKSDEQGDWQDVPFLPLSLDNQSFRADPKRLARALAKLTPQQRIERVNRDMRDSHGPYHKAKTLAEAAEALHAALGSDDLKRFRPLATQQKLHAGLRTLLAKVDKEAKQTKDKELADYYRQAVIPVLREAVDKSLWPRLAYLAFWQALEKPASDATTAVHRGFWLQLVLYTPRTTRESYRAQLIERDDGAVTGAKHNKAAAEIRKRGGTLVAEPAGKGIYTYVVISAGWKGDVKTLRRLAELDNLTRLGVNEVFAYDLETNLTHRSDDIKVTDAWMEPIGKIKTLRRLELVHHSHVTDAGLAHLSKLRNLRTLYIGGKGITNRGLVHLRGLTRLKHLELSNTSVTDAGLAHLSTLVALEGLYIGGEGINGAGLAHLSGAKNLREISLSFSKTLRDDNLKHLAVFKELRGLHLSGQPVSDAGLRHLSTLVNLERLQLHDAKITSAGLVHLRRMKRLKYLELEGTGVSDGAMAHVARLPNLTMLGLGRTKITDAGLAKLAGAKRLATLYLYNTEVSDAGLKHLQQLKSLRHLVVTRTRVTDKGVKALAAALPDLQVDK